MWSTLKSSISRWVPGVAKAQAASNSGKAKSNKAKGVLRISTLIWGLLLVTLVVLIWWLGPDWKFKEYSPLSTVISRVLATLIIVTTVIAAWAIRLMRRLRKLRAEQEQETTRKSDPVLSAIENQEAFLNDVLKEMTDSLGGGQSSRYRLPWFLVMGIESAGKTSLINRSGQEFALTRFMKATGKNLKSTQLGFDWWIGDKAIFIDPDGELLTQGVLQNGQPEEQKQRLWNHFVEWLERNRARRPLDGIILVVDVARITKAKVAERKAYAALLSSRLRELMEQHGSQLPVYITFSKLDLLLGFDDFFRHYARPERQAPFGFTFTAESLSKSEKWEAEFEANYDELLARLNQRLISLMSACRSREEREALFRFVRQLAGLRDILLSFLKETLSEDCFSTAAIVRGVYFTSVYQQGVPEDPFVDAAAKRYGMTDAARAAQRDTRNTLYFTEDLFRSVIYPEVGLATDNANVVKRRQQRRTASILACLFASVALVGGWSHFYTKNSQALADVEQRANAFLASQPEALQSDDPTGYDFLEPLDRLRSTLELTAGYRSHAPYLADMGLYQGHVIGAQVDRAYLAMLEHQFLPALMIGIMDDMNRAAAGSNEQLALLRILRMMSDASGRQPERVQRFMATRWQHYFPQQGEVQQRLLNHFNYAMAYSDLQGDIQAGDLRARTTMAPLNGSIVNAQNVLSRQPIDERVYATLKSSVNERHSALDLRQSVGTLFDKVFMSQGDNPELIKLPYLLTREGFQNEFLKELPNATELALIDAWVLGQRDNIHFSDADTQQLQTALRNHYVGDYRVSWRDALRHLELVPLPDVRQAIVVADALVGPQRPMERLLGAVEHNTSLYPQLAVDDEQAHQALRQSLRYQLAHDIEQPFVTVNQLMQSPDGNPATLEEIKTAITQFRDDLIDSEEVSNPGRAAFLKVRDRLSLQDTDNPIDNLKRIAANTPEPVGRMLHSLADQGWQLLMANATRHLESLWLDDVVAPFNARLAGRYPLAPNASQEVALRDFEDFFSPGGTLDAFYQHSLAPFMEGAENYLVDANGRPLLRASLPAAIQQAEQIRRAYFSRDGALDIEFSLEPISLSPDKRRSVISVDGQIIEYAHNVPRRVPVIWPNVLRSGTESRLTLVPSTVNRSPRSISKDGYWGWFRLLDQATVTSISERELTLSFTVDGGTMRYQLVANQTPNPFTRPLAAGFTLPTALYAERDIDAEER